MYVVVAPQGWKGRLPAKPIATECGLGEGALNDLLVDLANPPYNMVIKYESVPGHNCRSACFRVVRARGALRGIESWLRLKMGRYW